MKWSRETFSEEIVNSGRQPEVDLAKAVIIFCLALVHCTIECTPEESLASGIPYLFDSVIGGPVSAPMFMFAMGIGMVYTKHRTPQDYVRRGLKIGITGFALNLWRFLVPLFVGYKITGDYEKYIVPLPYRILGNDILQFACLVMLLMALFVWLRISKAEMLLICLGMSLLGTCVNGMDMGTPYCNIFLGYLIGTEDPAGMVASDFPLLNWMIVPASGYIFGTYLLRVKNKKRFYKKVSAAGLLITGLYFPVGISNRWGMFGEGQNCYYHLTTADAAVSLALTIGLLGIYYMLCEHLPDNVMICVGEVSRNINMIYCIHWVLVMFITNDILYILNGTQELSVSLTMLLGLSISIVSILTAHFWSGKMMRKGGAEMRVK